MKLKDLLQVLHRYNVIELYDNNNHYLGFYYDWLEVQEEYHNQKILSIWVNDCGQLEITIEKN